MNPRIAFPFLTIPDPVVHVDGCRLGPKGKPLSQVDVTLPNWDYACDLETRTSLSIDWVAASESLQLPAETLRLRATLLCGTGSGRFPRRWTYLASAALDADHDNAKLDGTLSGNALSGRLLIRLQITLDAPLSQGTSLSPKSNGARLWHADWDILIEDGGDARFPVEAASFNHVFHGRPQQHAPWFLLWQPDAWHSDFSSSIRLYVNTDQGDTLKRFRENDPILLQAVMGDAMSQLAEALASQDDLETLLAGCDEGSVGRQAGEWLELAFPGMEYNQIHALRHHDPGAFRGAILAAAETRELDQ